MPRFVLVHGQPGLLVGHPSRAGRQYVGKRPKSAEAVAAILKEKGKCSLADRFDDCHEVVALEPGDATIGKAVKAGELTQDGKAEVHPSLAVAVAKMLPAPAPPASSPSPSLKKAKPESRGADK